MKKIAIIGSMLFVAFNLLATAPVTAGQLNVTLTHEGASHGTTGTRVTVTLVHQGEGATYIYKYATPLVLLGNAHLATKMFKVVDLSDDSEVAYTGGWMHPTRLDEKYFFALRDGQSVSASYDLREDYKIVPGHHYYVTYRQDLSAVPTNERGDAISSIIRPSLQQDVQSNTLNIYVPDDSSQKQTITAPASASTASEVPFTADQVTQLQAAQAAAAQIASQTITYQDGLYTTTENPDGSSTTVFNGSTRYVWWFNNYDSTTPPSSNDTLVDQTVLAIFARLNYSGSSIQFHNGCVAGTDPNTAAVAQTATLYLINICPQFFTLPLNSTLDSASSQSSTLIHELSHFTDNYSPYPTVDYSVGAYTLSGAHSLALANRSAAVTNAANYEFYSVNTPNR